MGVKIVFFVFASQWGRVPINAFPDAAPCRKFENVGGPVSNTMLPFLLLFLIALDLHI